MSLGVIILAAGQGTRMRSDLPKVMHILGGKPLLGHVIDTAHALSAAAITVVYGHGGDRVRSAFADRAVGWAEQSRQLGTGHAVEQALPSMADMDRVLVLYGDVPLTRRDTLDRLIDAAAQTPLAVLTVELADPTGYGRIVRDGTGRIQRIVEQKDASAAERTIREVNTGIMVIDRRRLVEWISRLDSGNAQGELYLTDIIEMAVAEGVGVAAVRPSLPEEVMGVNDRSQLAHLERFHQREQAESLMRAGVSLRDPARFDLRGSLTAGRDVTIDINVIIEGDVLLGDRVQIGPNCVLRDCRVGDDTLVYANCVIEQATIGADARVGPYSRIRPDAELADRVHVGNFVEIKKSTVGLGSKVNHLSYVGDSRIGAGVNVGAGTITCNYDGANKHRTVIEDGAFIGSNTALVAPVTVGAGATVGAGSVISRDAPPERLTLTRARQTTVEGWRRPMKEKK